MARSRGGFTLIELVIALAILAVLVTLATPVVQVQLQRQKEAELRAALREIRTALDNYKRAVDDGRVLRGLDESGYPPSLEVLVGGVQDAKSARRGALYFLRRIPRDPMHPDPSLSAADTWAKRSYESPPDAPEAGDNVFDVYSLSPRVGLNGVPYRQW
jgi:general secretion pathway protein G